MTQEEKELLLKDLCTRLPYGVKGRIFAETTNGEFDIAGDMIFNDKPFVVVLDEINVGNGEIRVTAIDDEICDFIDSVQDWGDPYTMETFKPYLRSLSSMTEEEALKVVELCVYNPKDVLSVSVKQDCISVEIDDGVAGSDTHTIWFNEIVTSIELVDWLNAHHFDYRGLIEMRLALEAPEGMYNTKSE